MVRPLIAALLCLCALALLAGVSRAEKEPARLALLIGNQGYAASVGVLKNPHNDIALVGEALARQGFTLLPPVKDATRVNILRAIRDFSRQLGDAGPGAVGFFYYSGHGASEAGTNVNYLIPIDAQKPGSETFWDESVNLDEVLKLLGNASAAAKFVVFDACRNELRLPYRGAKGFAPVREQPGIFVAYTAAPGQPASDDGETSGPYAAALAAELAKPGLDHLALFQNVKEAVYEATHHAQQPWESNGLFKRVYLAGLPSARESMAAAPSGARPPVSECGQLWARVEDKRDIKIFESYRRQCGAANPAYDALAEEKIAALKAQPVAIAAPPAPAPAPVRPVEDACEDGLLVSVASSVKSPCIKPGSGESFKDCPDCPEMVIAPAGSFTMGSPESEPERFSDEGPQHKVTIGKPFAVGRFAVTFAEWDACVSAGGCGGYRPSDSGWGREDRPVINVSWDDAQTYVKWLSGKTGKTYRLLSEAEFEHAARAGTAMPFWWGSSITPDRANYNGNYVYAGGGQKGEYRQKTMPVKSFKPNPWGLYQVHGNVWQWVQDCYVDSYRDAPRDGLPIKKTSGCSRVLRGGSWGNNPWLLRAARRVRFVAGGRYDYVGFRVARTF